MIFVYPFRVTPATGPLAILLLCVRARHDWRMTVSHPAALAERLQHFAFAPSHRFSAGGALGVGTQAHTHNSL